MSGELRGICGRIRSSLPALIGDEGGVDRTAVFAHLRACPGCRGEYGAYVRAERALQRLAALPEPQAGFFAELERDTLAAVPARPARPKVVGWWVAVACFLGGIAVPVLFHWTTGPAGPGAGLKGMPAAQAARGAAPSDRLQSLSVSSRHRGLRGLQLSDQTQWSDPPPPRAK